MHVFTRRARTGDTGFPHSIAGRLGESVKVTTKSSLGCRSSTFLASLRVAVHERPHVRRIKQEIKPGARVLPWMRKAAVARTVRRHAGPARRARHSTGIGTYDDTRRRRRTRE
jgi:hypothetical protein